MIVLGPYNHALLGKKPMSEDKIESRIHGEQFEPDQPDTMLPRLAVLHGSGAARNAPYPRRNSGGAFEIGTAKFGHPIEYADANLGFGFLIFERACLEFGPDHGLPATH